MTIDLNKDHRNNEAVILGKNKKKPITELIVWERETPNDLGVHIQLYGEYKDLGCLTLDSETAIELANEILKICKPVQQ